MSSPDPDTARRTGRPLRYGVPTTRVQMRIPEQAAEWLNDQRRDGETRTDAMVRMMRAAFPGFDAAFPQ